MLYSKRGFFKVKLPEDFKKKYAENFSEEVKDFSKEISENRDDSLSDFAKTIKKIYHSKDENTDC